MWVKLFPNLVFTSLLSQPWSWEGKVLHKTIEEIPELHFSAFTEAELRPLTQIAQLKRRIIWKGAAFYVSMYIYFLFLLWKRGAVAVQLHCFTRLPYLCSCSLSLKAALVFMGCQEDFGGRLGCAVLSLVQGMRWGQGLCPGLGQEPQESELWAKGLRFLRQPGDGGEGTVQNMPWKCIQNCSFIHSNSEIWMGCIKCHLCWKDWMALAKSI